MKEPQSQPTGFQINSCSKARTIIDPVPSFEHKDTNILRLARNMTSSLLVCILWAATLWYLHVGLLNIGRLHATAGVYNIQATIPWQDPWTARFRFASDWSWTLWLALRGRIDWRGFEEESDSDEDDTEPDDTVRCQPAATSTQRNTPQSKPSITKRNAAGHTEESQAHEPSSPNTTGPPPASGSNSNKLPDPSALPRKAPVAGAGASTSEAGGLNLGTATGGGVNTTVPLAAQAPAYQLAKGALRIQK